MSIVYILNIYTKLIFLKCTEIQIAENKKDSCAEK
jgi:hypothetical protein